MIKIHLKIKKKNLMLTNLLQGHIEVFLCQPYNNFKGMLNVV